jgi:serine carboxypeptidase-like clade 1
MSFLKSQRALRINFHLILQCLLQINLAQILEPQCAFASGKPKEIEWDLRVQESGTMDYLLSQNELPELRCRVNQRLQY